MSIKTSNQSGLIPLLIMILILVIVVVVFAYEKVHSAQQ